MLQFLILEDGLDERDEDCAARLVVGAQQRGTVARDDGLAHTVGQVLALRRLGTEGDAGWQQDVAAIVVAVYDGGDVLADTLGCDVHVGHEHDARHAFAVGRDRGIDVLILATVDDQVLVSSDVAQLLLYQFCQLFLIQGDRKLCGVVGVPRLGVDSGVGREATDDGLYRLSALLLLGSFGCQEGGSLRDLEEWGGFDGLCSLGGLRTGSFRQLQDVCS